MNKVELIGRLTRDPKVRYSSGENSKANASFTLAVNRRFKNNEGNYDADFIRCVAFGKTAETIEKHIHKGNRIAVSGHIQTESYDNKEGQKVFTTDVVVEELDFLENKSSDEGNKSNASQGSSDAGDGFMNIPDGIDEELPFV